jgi:hypothetical protein
MKTYMTIRQTASETGLAAGTLRTRLKHNKLPGFYAGNRYYINVPLLMEMIDAECRLNAALDRAECEKDGDNAR